MVRARFLIPLAILRSEAYASFCRRATALLPTVSSSLVRWTSRINGGLTAEPTDYRGVDGRCDEHSRCCMLLSGLRSAARLTGGKAVLGEDADRHVVDAGHAGMIGGHFHG